MCPGKVIRHLAVVVFLTALSCGTVHAQDADADAALFKGKLERLPLHCDPPLFRAYVTAESGKFAFIIPSGYRTRGGSSSNIKLCNLEGNCQITFTVLDPTPRGPDPLNPDTYRDVVQALHPKGKIIEQLCPGVAGREGVGFDIQWETTNKFAQCTRVAFIPTATGLLEFTATSSPQNFSNVRYQLNEVMAGFQAVTPDEKLVVPTISATDNDRTDARTPQRDGQRQMFAQTCGVALPRNQTLRAS